MTRLRFLLRWVLVGVGLLYATEAGLWIAGVSVPESPTPAEVVGWANRPGEAFWTAKEGAARVEINAFGFRGPERAAEKPPGTLRVAVLGDSFVYAQQVPYEDTFGAVLERTLTTPERPVEVLNCGVDGFSTYQELLLFRRWVHVFQPDVVILAFFPGNDIRDNHAGFVDGLGDHRPQPDHDPNWRDAPMAVGPPELSGRGFRHRVYDLLALARIQYLLRAREAQGIAERIATEEDPRTEARWEAWSQEWGQEGAAALARTDRRVPACDPDRTTTRQAGYGEDERYCPPEDELWAQAWALTEEILVTLDRDVKAVGGRLFVVTLTDGTAASPSDWRRKSLARSLGVPHLGYPEGRLRALGSAAGLPVLTLAEPFSHYADRYNAHLHGFPNGILGAGHWNREGHWLAGRLLASWLTESLTPAGARPDDASP